MSRKPRLLKSQKRLGLELADTSQFRITDFQRHCIVRGMPFEEVITADVHTMRRFIFSNRGEKIDPTLLDKYDDWVEEELAKAPKGHQLIHPSLRLGYIAETDDDGNTVTRKRVKGIKKAKKPKRERTELGVFKGTKKALTYECAKEGLSMEETAIKVQDQFPDAKLKSINIWYKRAKKALQTK